MDVRRSGRAMLAASAAVAVFLGVPSEAPACGGFFCSQSQPVNQAAERIIFADNGDGTVTAVIQILYQGPSENFSWLLPIPTVPEGETLGVASDLAFTRLQTATNPQYTLTTRVEGTCAQPPPTTGGVASAAGGAFAASTGGTTNSGGAAGMQPPVTVEASGVVGAFDWVVISVAQDIAEPAQEAVTWLEDNNYDVPEGTPGLLGPYLAEGMVLLALKLTKGSDTGSIRPLVLTYQSAMPMIPIRPTAVAANADMGVMTWVVGGARAVPFNYRALELNEARINWFNAGSTYNSVVIAAADEAGGQGFVTEFAGASSSLGGVVWTSFDDSLWTSFQQRVFTSFSEMFTLANQTYGAWSGFWDAMREVVTLPEGLMFEDFQLCPSCYADQVEFAPSQFMAALESNVIAPLRDVQILLDRNAYVTRLYTTMSAAEMTVDPAFTFNDGLADLSNLHSAERIIECSPSVYLSQAPWRIELPQGGVVRGTAADVGRWPTADEITTQPFNHRVLQLSSSGEGQVVLDNSGEIDRLLADYNATIPSPPNAGGTGSGSRATGGRAAGGTNGDGGDPANGGQDEGPGQDDLSDDDGCSIGGASAGFASGLWAALVGLAALGRRRSFMARSTLRREPRTSVRRASGDSR